MARTSPIHTVRDYSLPSDRDLDAMNRDLDTMKDDAVVDAVARDAFVRRHVQQIETGDEKRKDTGKAAGFWLIPSGPLAALAHVYKIGADKYSPRGWESGMEWSRIVDPMFRHILAWMRGEKYDKTDGQHHLASVAWACFALMEYENTHPELDNLERGEQ
jgi:hypothetical protein